MERLKTIQVIEAILFLHEEPVKAEKVAEILEIPPDDAHELLGELGRELAAQGRGVQVYEVAGGYQMGTVSDAAPFLEKLFTEGNSTLTSASMETLAIIAYKQPVTRVEIESIRGVKCEHVLDNLIKRKLIRVSGRKDAPGRPLLYNTTADFLKYFGLKNLKELPALDEEELVT